MLVSFSQKKKVLHSLFNLTKFPCTLFNVIMTWVGQSCMIKACTELKHECFDRCPVWRWCRLISTGSKMSTRLLTLSQKTGKARFFFTLHAFIHFVCGHLGSGQPVSFGAVFSFTQVDSTNYCLTRKQRVALMFNQLNCPLVQGLTLPSRRPHRSTGWSRRKREERRFWRTGCLYWEFRCLSKAPMPSKVQSRHICPTQTLSSLEIHSLKKKKKENHS